MTDETEDPIFLMPHHDADEPFLLLEGDEHGCLEVEKTGYYFNPPCDAMCCPAIGPFEDMVAARVWARAYPWRLTLRVEPPHYAGIGSRHTPTPVLGVMEQIGETLAGDGWILRSGAAEGADAAFERRCDRANGSKEIFLPWAEYNGHPSRRFKITKEMERVAAIYHPGWDTMSERSKKMIACNGPHVLGHRLMKPVSVIVCWRPHGEITGRTGQALRIAEDRDIPVINLCDPAFQGLNAGHILEGMREIALSKIRDQE